MKSFYKILKFVLPYKLTLITASFFAILFSISNGLTYYSVVPIIDTLADSGKAIEFSISKEEQALLDKNDPGFTDQIRSLPASVKKALNSFFRSKTRNEILITVSIGIIPLVAIRALLDFIAQFLFSLAGNKAVLAIRKKLFSHLISLPYKYFHKSRSGEIISRITRDVEPLAAAVSTEIYNFVSGIILLITNIVILSLISVDMILFVLIVIPFIAVPINSLGNIVKKYQKKIQEGFGDVSSHLQETFSGIKVIKSFGMERFENNKFNIINNRIFSRDLKKRVYQNLNPAIVELLGALAAVVLFIYGGYQIINGHITSGEFIFFMLIVLNLFNPVKMISEAVNGTKAGEAASRRIFDILDYPEEDFISGTDGTFRTGIRFIDVSFKYTDNYVLEGVNIDILKGRSTAIVGPSGSGKSTILNMIASFYSPTEGRVLFDEIDTRGLSLGWLRQQTAVVTQEVFLFHGTVLENITCGIDFPKEQVIEAAKIAHAHEFIMDLPLGYDTIVGERGALLSGGERQRISIARAVLADPEIILFDEATSALDSESEKLIQDSLEYLFKNRTSVIVSHRLSTIRNSDLIYLIENGKIIDKGTHTEMAERSEGYRRLFSY